MLIVRNLTIRFKTKKGLVTAVNNVSFNLQKGETLGVVGESGCGKSITNMAIMGLLPHEPSFKLMSFHLTAEISES